MWFVLAALAGLSDARPYGPVRDITLQDAGGLPVPADLLAYDDRIWRLDRQRVVVQHRDGSVDTLPIQGATLWLGPPGFPHIRQRGAPTGRIVLSRQGRDPIWNLADGTLDEPVCGGTIAPYGWSDDCRAILHDAQRLTPAKYSRLAVSGGRLWVFSAGQVQVFDGPTRAPRLPGPIVHLAHDPERIFVGVPNGVRALDATTSEVIWSVNRTTTWLQPSGPHVALRTHDDLLLLDRETGAIAYTLEDVGNAVFAWTPEGDLVGVDGTSVVRFDLAESDTEPRPAPASRLPDGLVPAGRIAFEFVDPPAEVERIRVDGVTHLGRPAGVAVAPIDRQSLTGDAAIDVTVQRTERSETIRVLRPDAGTTVPVRLAWAPVGVELEGCATNCAPDLGPRLLGSEVAIDHAGRAADGTPMRWTHVGVHLGTAWRIAPLAAE